MAIRAVVCKLVVVLLALSMPPFAQAGTPLGVCLPSGNGDNLSSDSCPCAGNSDCLGVCLGSTHLCSGATDPDPPICAAPGNQANVSADGCPCSANSDCVGVCQGSTFRCSGATTVDPPICVMPGSGGDLSADGCPCESNNDCSGNCSFFTHTCGGVVGRVRATPAAISGLASADIEVGQNVVDAAGVSGTTYTASRVTFTLYGPGQPQCGGSSLFFASAPIDANTTITSAPFTTATPGKHRWIAAYSGNAWTLSARTDCADPLQHVYVNAFDAIFHDDFDPR